MKKYRKKPIEIEAMRFPDDGPGQVIGHKAAGYQANSLKEPDNPGKDQKHT